ncbi:hypothetical protein [Furfurilactobacillus rossiae]|uniref:Lipoprotein n=1 Tax=Furfurilactobacillus rossiae DSM 15814 TaxID=1114972 RepID=A0A0R1RIT1_9LACO|nr:hypothetical protein [Furfurilactobacillus rossiae]KRL56630.1 hypothetical protein FD35_GL001725 [Furfurilactobacillus rossiae DSM 15814]QFR66469.1 hypothetical protein LR814_04890 [Furfurilactobacillus rossiae]QLE61930.1 RhoGEF Guanine nucleotide exchange factor for Rho-Rac-Cdc42-like GTPases-like [Furfurilactobacillus rossiae]
MKKSLTLAITVLSALLLTACGNSNSKSSSSTSSKPRLSKTSKQNKKARQQSSDKAKSESISESKDSSSQTASTSSQPVSQSQSSTESSSTTAAQSSNSSNEASSNDESGWIVHNADEATSLITEKMGDQRWTVVGGTFGGAHSGYDENGNPNPVSKDYVPYISLQNSNGDMYTVSAKGEIAKMN